MSELWHFPPPEIKWPAIVQGARASPPDETRGKIFENACTADKAQRYWRADPALARIVNRVIPFFARQVRDRAEMVGGLWQMDISRRGLGSGSRSDKSLFFENMHRHPRGGRLSSLGHRDPRGETSREKIRSHVTPFFQIQGQEQVQRESFYEDDQ
jgi:hypothetical protein